MRPFASRHRRWRFRFSIVVSSCVAMSCLTHSACVWAESSSVRAAKFASNEGNLTFLALGMGLNLLEDGSAGPQRSLRSTDAVLTSSLMSEILKKTVREERPDGSGHSSFPSGHATAAFAAATMQSEYHPWQTPLWMTGAALIGASRVKLHRHYIHDVVAGGWHGGT